MIHLDFRPLEASDAPLFADFLHANPTVSCEKAWGNLRLYRDSYEWRFAVAGNTLFTLGFQSGLLQFPAGAVLPPPELAEIVRNCISPEVPEVCCYDVPESYVGAFPEVTDYFEVEFEEGEADYLYDLAHLASFEGEKLRKKHNQVRQFERDYRGRFEVKPLTGETLADALKLARFLNSFRPDEGSIAEENKSLARLESEFGDPALALDGIVLYVDKVTAGFSIFSPIVPGLADIHFEKANRDFHGSGTMVTAELIRYLLTKGFTRMNREQDLGIPGLRQAKQSWEPSEMYRRGTLTLRTGRN